MIVLQKDESYMITFRIGEVSICFIPQNFVDDSLFRKSLLFIKICEYLRNLVRQAKPDFSNDLKRNHHDN